MRGEKRGRDCLKEHEGISQRTCMKNLWKWRTWRSVWALTVKVGVGWAEGGERGKIGTTVTA